jgi:hypothetical protein
MDAERLSLLWAKVVKNCLQQLLHMPSSALVCMHNVIISLRGCAELYAEKLLSTKNYKSKRQQLALAVAATGNH